MVNRAIHSKAKLNKKLKKITKGQKNKSHSASQVPTRSNRHGGVTGSVLFNNADWASQLFFDRLNEAMLSNGMKGWCIAQLRNRVYSRARLDHFERGLNSRCSATAI